MEYRHLRETFLRVRESQSPCGAEGLSRSAHSPRAVLLEDAIQGADQLFGVDELLHAQGVHLLVEVCDLHPSLNKETELLGQVGEELVHVRCRSPRGAAAGHHFLQLVMQGSVDGADGVLPAEE